MQPSGYLDAPLNGPITDKPFPLKLFEHDMDTLRLALRIYLNKNSIKIKYEHVSLPETLDGTVLVDGTPVSLDTMIMKNEINTVSCDEMPPLEEADTYRFKLSNWGSLKFAPVFADGETLCWTRLAMHARYGGTIKPDQGEWLIIPSLGKRYINAQIVFPGLEGKSPSRVTYAIPTEPMELKEVYRHAAGMRIISMGQPR